MEDTAKTAPRTVFPQDLSGILSHFPRVKILSLDCFDTLLWRNCAAPTDVFYDLQHAPAFHKYGLTATLRMTAEGFARNLMRARTGLREVRLAHIYRAAIPALDDAHVAELAEAEIAAEIRTCYAFPDAIKLIRDARRRGLRIVLVSDTYFSQQELRRLLTAALPADVLTSIDAVFSSIDHGHSKAGGLFRTVLQRLHVRPEEILHIGDNESADLAAPIRLGIKAVHITHHPDVIAQAVRMEAAATTLFHPAARQTRSLPAVYHGSLAQCPVSDPSDVLGRVGVGPLMHAFAHFIRHRAELLHTEGRGAKILFLMRDGFLPMQALHALTKGEGGPTFPTYSVEISRFAAYAASFRSEEDVDRYLARMAGPVLEALARQLLLPESAARNLITRARSAKNPFDEFSRLVHRPKTIDEIIENSRAYRDRLRHYLERAIGLSEGDRLLLVDLGYSGTVQTCLEPLAREEWGVDIAGCYLLLARTPGWETSRSGLIAPDFVDDNAINALVTNVAALEQICTADQGSVIDYTDDGLPIRKPPDIAPEQYERIKPVQAACCQFVLDTETFFCESAQRPALEDIRVNALGLLGRLLFFPTAPETESLRGFELDVNLSTDATISLFHTAQAQKSLRRLGPAYTLVEERLNQPMELRTFGLELATTALAHHRFRWDIALDDLSHVRLHLPIMLAKGSEISTATVEAHPTFDGYYAALVAVGACDYEFSIQFGRLCAWLQIESVTLHPVDDLYRKRTVFDNSPTEDKDLTDLLIFENIDRFDGGLIRCRDEGAFVFVPTRLANVRSGRFACRIVFRPLADHPAAQAGDPP